MHADGLAEQHETVVLHLLGELTGGHQDQTARSTAALTDVRAQAGEGGRPKAKVLRSPLRAVPSTSRPRGVEQGGGLDGERVADLAPLQHRHQRLGQAQLGEGRAGGGLQGRSRWAGRRTLGSSTGAALFRSIKDMRGGTPVF